MNHKTRPRDRTRTRMYVGPMYPCTVRFYLHSSFLYSFRLAQQPYYIAMRCLSVLENL